MRVYRAILPAFAQPLITCLFIDERFERGHCVTNDGAPCRTSFAKDGFRGGSRGSNPVCVWRIREFLQSGRRSSILRSRIKPRVKRLVRTAGESLLWTESNKADLALTALPHQQSDRRSRRETRIARIPLAQPRGWLSGSFSGCGSLALSYRFTLCTKFASGQKKSTAFRDILRRLRKSVRKT